MNPQPKHKTHRDEDYKAFIRNKPCIICARKAVAHHEAVTNRGIGIKCSDYETLPLCEVCHEARHRLGRDTFWQGYNIERLIIGYLSEYIKREK